MEMTTVNEPIRGSVARIEDQYTLIINRGAAHGVKPDMIFAVMADGGDEIVDPENGEVIGELPIEKLRVKVFDVQPKYSRAATFRTFTPPRSESIEHWSRLRRPEMSGMSGIASDLAKQLYGSGPGAFDSLSTALSGLIAAEIENPSPVRQKIVYEAPAKSTEAPVRREVTVNIGDKIQQVVADRRPARQG
jgi:hypothetical protein